MPKRNKTKIPGFFSMRLGVILKFNSLVGLVWASIKIFNMYTYLYYWMGLYIVVRSW
jgi:hypothetical protein